MKKNIAAFTSEDAYPAYVSINNLDDNHVEITMRGEASQKNGHTVYGETVSAILSRTQFHKLMAEVATGL